MTKNCDSLGGCYGSYYPSIWHPYIQYSNQFHFQKVRWNPEGNLDCWITSRRHTKMLSSEGHVSE